jgi:peptide-methionine (S)-S-oxide reductase
MTQNQANEVITFGGGCFWCTEAVFSELRGVVEVASGYAGGTVPAPTYQQVCGGDTGTQYRSVVFYRTAEQKAVAEQVIKELTDAKLWSKRVVTELTPFTTFYKAEDYHQEYFANNGRQPYCQMVIAPKVAKFREHYREKLRA